MSFLSYWRVVERLTGSLSYSHICFEAFSLQITCLQIGRSEVKGFSYREIKKQNMHLKKYFPISKLQIVGMSFYKW